MAQSLREKWTAEHRRIVRDFREWMQSHEPALSQPQAARRLGISHSALSPMLNEKYSGDVAAICRDMKRIMRRSRMREIAPERPPYVATSITEEVVRACGVAHTEGITALVIGPSGIGKTVGLERYQQEEPDAVYVYLGQGATAHGAVHEVARVLGLDASGGVCTLAIRRCICDALEGDPDRLIICDEMDYVPEETLQALRQVFDQTQCGQVWCGTRALLEKVRGNGSPTLRQVMRRIRYTADLDYCSDDDIRRALEYYELPREVEDAVVEGAGGEIDRALSAVVSARRIVGDEDRISSSVIDHVYATLFARSVT